MEKTLMRIPLILIVFFLSCATVKPKNREIKSIVNLEGDFLNKPIKSSKTYRDLTILQSFNIKLQEEPDVVNIKIVSENQCNIKYKDTTVLGGYNTKRFFGKYHRNKYFEIFYSNNKIEIPPVLGLIYSKVNIDRVRIHITKDDNLHIQKKIDKYGNILFLGGGISAYYLNKYKNKSRF